MDIDETLIFLINEKFKGKTKQIQLTGGEPFLNANIEKYINLLSENFELRIPTNGSLLCNYSDNLIKKLGFIQFSLYGCNEEDYLKFTGFSKGWNLLKKSIEKVNKCEVPYILSLVLDKSNINLMENYVQAAISLGASRIKFGIPTLVGRACDDLASEKTFLLSQDELKYAYRESRKLKMKYSGKISVAIWSHRSTEPVKPLFDSKQFENLLPCGAGYSSYVISQSGRIRPCELLSEDFFDFGDIKKFDRFIEGNFYNNYSCSINNFKKYLNSCGADLEHICTPLKALYDKFHGDE